MATIIPTIAINNGYNGAYGTIVATWANMQNGDVGDIVTPHTDIYSDVSFQAIGTFGAGGSVAVEGSNNSTDYEPLHNAQGVTIALVAPSISTVLEAVAASRPHVTAGDGTTSITVIAFYRRTL